MKLLYSIILTLTVLKLALTRPLNSSAALNVSTSAEYLVKYYDTELDLLAQEIDMILKNISEEILKDEIVQNPSTSLMHELKENMTEFQQLFPYYKRFGVNETIISDFADKIKIFYYPNPYDRNKDFLHIKQLLTKLGYSEIRDKYEKKFKKMFNEKFLKKFEELKEQITNKTEYDLKVLKWIDLLKQCQDYECFLIDFHGYEKINGGFFDQLFGNLIDGIFKQIIINSHNVTVFAQAVLKDAKLAQLSLPVRQQLNKNLQDLIKIHEIFGFQHIFYLQVHVINYHVLFKFDNYANISSKERQLITNIFKQHHYESLHFTDEKENKLEEDDYIKEYENEKANFKTKKLNLLKAIFDDIERLIQSTSPQERKDIFENLQNLLVNMDNLN